MCYHATNSRCSNILTNILLLGNYTYKLTGKLMQFIVYISQSCNNHKLNKTNMYVLYIIKVFREYYKFRLLFSLFYMRVWLAGLLLVGFGLSWNCWFNVTSAGELFWYKLRTNISSERNRHKVGSLCRHARARRIRPAGPVFMCVRRSRVGRPPTRAARLYVYSMWRAYWNVHTLLGFNLVYKFDVHFISCFFRFSVIHLQAYKLDVRMLLLLCTCSGS